MRIERIIYKRLENLGNYSNEAIEATTLLDEGEDPTEAFKKLRTWAEDQIRVRESVAQMLAQHASLREDLEAHKARIELIAERWEILAQKLEGSNLTVQDLKNILDIPF